MAEEDKAITDHETIMRDAAGDDAVDDGQVDVEDIASTEKPVKNALNLDFSCQIGTYTLRALQDVVVETAVAQLLASSAMGEASLRQAVQETIRTKINVTVSEIVSQVVEEEFNRPFKSGKDEWLNAREYIALCGKKVLQEHVNADGKVNNSGWGTNKTRLQWEINRQLNNRFEKEINKATSEVSMAAFKAVQEATEKAKQDMKNRLKEAAIK